MGIPIPSAACVLLILCCLSPFTVTSAAASEAQVADRIVRFVNDAVITQGEVWETMRTRYLTMRRRGVTLPESEAELQEFQTQILQEMTEDLLLSQEARRMGIMLDMSFIRRQVRDWIRDNNLSPTVSEEAKEQKRRVREAEVFAVLRHYRRQWPEITPAAIQGHYRANRDLYAQAPRARAGRILIRPAGADDAQRHLRALMTALQQVQSDSSPGLAAAIDDNTLTAIARSPESERADRIQDALAATLPHFPAEPRSGTADLRRRIEGLLNQQFSDASQVQAKLEKLRRELLTIDDLDARQQRFSELAQKHSQGPNAANGGDLGWQEQGYHGQPLDELIFSLAVGKLSDPFPLGEFIGLLMVSERDDADMRSLREVAPEIRASLEAQRLAAIRATLVEQLRQRGVVRDLELSPTLPDEWFSTRGG